MEQARPDFYALVEDAIAALPSQFADQLASVAIVVDDEPTPAQLASTGARSLFGLYQGVPRTAYGAHQAPVANRITLFRGPLERAHRDSAALAAAVEETLFHEVAHHLGISDRRLVELRRGLP